MKINPTYMMLYFGSLEPILIHPVKPEKKYEDRNKKSVVAIFLTW
jgi:hypothetical protein